MLHNHAGSNHYNSHLNNAEFVLKRECVLMCPHTIFLCSPPAWTTDTKQIGSMDSCCWLQILCHFVKSSNVCAYCTFLLTVDVMSDYFLWCIVISNQSGNSLLIFFIKKCFLPQNCFLLHVAVLSRDWHVLFL